MALNSKKLITTALTLAALVGCFAMQRFGGPVEGFDKTLTAIVFIGGGALGLQYSLDKGKP